MPMRNAIRCCISCILPCGALDVIRIVHIDGHVEEISHAGVTAAEIMKLNPKHVLRKPSSSPPAEDAGTRERSKITVHVVSPDAVLKRGEIYFLIPLPLPPPSTKKRRKSAGKKEVTSAAGCGGVAKVSGSGFSLANFPISDRYLSEILSEKISMDRRRGRAAVWRPRLESISETPAEA